jgi:hypothetical protein
MKLQAVPLLIREANVFIRAYHRHNRPAVGARFCIGASADGDLVGVAVVSRPISRRLASRYVAEVTRVCTSPGAPKGTNSFLYAACWRAWKSMGGTRLVTYTLTTESGASLRGAGWKIVAETTVSGKPWCGPDRQREYQEVYGQIKFRWEVG